MFRPILAILRFRDYYPDDGLDSPQHVETNINTPLYLCYIVYYV
jgi:hypothetical protein